MNGDDGGDDSFPFIHVIMRTVYAHSTSLFILLIKQKA